MVQQVHLEHCLFSGHGAEIELLGAGDAQIILGCFGCKGGFLLYAAVERTLFQTAGQASLIFADLAFDSSHSRVNGSKHIGRAFACPEPGTCAVNRQFHIVPVLFHRIDNQCFRILLKEPCQLHYLFLSISMDIVRKLYFLFTELEFHMRQLLSYHRSSGVL